MVPISTISVEPPNFSITLQPRIDSRLTPMPPFSLAELEAAAALVRAVVPQTPQHAWPLLAERTGTQVWVKHENHTPIGAFKLRGGLVYMDWLTRSGPKVSGGVTATRGNHGQSIALAGRRAGVPVTILIPRGNSAEKNAAMAGFGAELIVHGRDFDEAKARAVELAAERKLHYLPSFDPLLVKGVATYALELFRAVPDLDTVYVPIGMGSGICGLIAVRDLLGLSTAIVGVVAAAAPAVALSVEAGRPVPTDAALTFADGLACREPHPEALAAIARGAARIVRVDEDEIAAAMRLFWAATHNVAEGAGAAALAALLKERDRMQGKRIGLICSGGNVDSDILRTVLEGKTPTA
jgi:threonine dehydratase